MTILPTWPCACGLLWSEHTGLHYDLICKTYKPMDNFQFIIWRQGRRKYEVAHDYAL